MHGSARTNNQEFHTDISSNTAFPKSEEKIIKRRRVRTTSAASFTLLPLFFHLVSRTPRICQESGRCAGLRASEADSQNKARRAPRLHFFRCIRASRLE
jgi:hypothetical protein